MRWIVSEHSISEHVSEFNLDLPKNYEVLTVLIKGNPTPDHPMAGGPCLYVRYPEGTSERVVVHFIQLENGQAFEGAYQYVGSYQDRGYHKVNHLFREVKLRPVE